MIRRMVLAAAAVTFTLAVLPTVRAGAAGSTPRLHTVAELGWFQSDVALWLAVGIVFIGLAVAIAFVFAPKPGANQLAGSTLQGVRNGTSMLTNLGEQATQFAERSLSHHDRGSRLNTALERAGIAMRPSEFVVLATTATFATFAVGLVLTNLVVAVVAAVFVPLLCRIGVTGLAERRSEKFADQLEQTLPLLSGSLRAGFGIMQAFDAVARESESPTSQEFHRLVVETRLGRDLNDALVSMAARVKSEDFDWIVQAIEIHRQVGGDLAEVLDNAFGTIRDRNRIRRQIKALSAEGRLSAVILFVLPLGMFGVITVLNPNYIAELTGDALGITLLLVAGGLLVVGGLWLRRIVRLVF